jgi:hypothetical protein
MVRGALRRDVANDTRDAWASQNQLSGSDWGRFQVIGKFLRYCLEMGTPLNMRRTTSPQPSPPLRGGEGEEVADFAGFRGSIRAIGFGEFSPAQAGEGNEAREQAFDYHFGIAPVRTYLEIPPRRARRWKTFRNKSRRESGIMRRKLNGSAFASLIPNSMVQAVW